MDRVLFVDVDGVLITRQSIFKFKSARVFDPICVKNFNYIVKKLNPDLVISSTWRLRRDTAQLTELFRKFGVWGNIIGKTPHIDSDRGIEIGMWIRENAFTGDFCILDDEIFDMGEFKPFVVQTSMDGGLQPHHVIAILKKFGLK